MGLFDKKYCDICGDKIGLLGNRKLEDGNCCKNCAAKLSPWFSERRSSTVEEIKAQIEYREANKNEVARFTPTRSFGKNYYVFIDDNQKKFLVSRSSNYQNINPDVIDLSDVTGADLDIIESRREEKRKDADGKEVSYNPPRYIYEYDFDMNIRVNHPYINEISFELNPSNVEIDPRQQAQSGYAGMSHMIANRVINGVSGAGSRPSAGNRIGASYGTQGPNVNLSREYQEYLKMGNEIKAALLQQDARSNAPAYAAGAGAGFGSGRQTFAKTQAPQGPVKCPACGAVTTPDASGCCEYCGSPVK